MGSLPTCLGCAFAVCLAASAVADDERAAWLTEVRRAASVGRAIAPEEDAAGAVDGVIDGGISFHTDEESEPWWQVDLEAVKPIARVMIYNTGTLDRAARLSVLLSDDGRAWRKVYQHDQTQIAKES